MADTVRHSTAAGMAIAAAGAGLGGLLAWLFAPEIFPAALIVGALIAGAGHVVWILARSGSDKPDRSS